MLINFKNVCHSDFIIRLAIYMWLSNRRKYLIRADRCEKRRLTIKNIFSTFSCFSYDWCQSFSPDRKLNANELLCSNAIIRNFYRRYRFSVRGTDYVLMARRRYSEILMQEGLITKIYVTCYVVYHENDPSLISRWIHLISHYQRYRSIIRKVR